MKMIKNVILISIVGILLINSNGVSMDNSYQQRRNQVLNWAQKTDESNFLIAGAKICHKKSSKTGIKMFEKELARADNSHRGMFVIYELMTGYLAAEPCMKSDLKKKVRDYMATANFYRGDTENHLAMYYTGLYLAAQTFADLPANGWYTGKPAAENMAEAEEYLLDWIRITTTIGQGEFDSPTYMTVFLAPMFSLYQWAKDPKMKQNALGMLYWLIGDYAVEHLKGLYVGAHSREYPERLIMPKHRNSNMTSWGWLFFGQTEPMMHPTLLTAAMSDFELPVVLYNIGTDRQQPYVHTETKRVRNIIRLSDQKNPPVYKYTYMTKDFALGSMMGGDILQPIQQHVWDVSFISDSPYMSIFTKHPFVGTIDLAMFFPEEMKFTIDEVARAHSYYGSEDKWSSSSPYEKTFQHKNALIVLYNIPEGVRFGHIDGFFPKDLARREEDDSGWIFCQGGNSYIAYYPLKPYQWIEEAECFRLRSYELKNGCVIEVASADDYESFDAFKSQIHSNPVVHDTFDQTLMVGYTTSDGDVMTFAYDGARRLNGKPIDFADYRLFSGPFLNAEIGERKLEMIHGNSGVMVDFANEDRALLLPVYVCPKIDEDFELTGKMNHPLWKIAPVAILNDAVTGESGGFSTRVKLLYSENFLYVGFECEDDYIWGTVAYRNGPVYDEECVEVFLNPANCGHQYYEINLSPKNVIYDACVINSRSPQNPFGEFKPLFEMNFKNIKTSSHIFGEVDKPGKGKRWTAEYAIPFDELFGAKNSPPQPGDSWRVNFYRIDSPEMGRREHYSWSQTGRLAFHLPWRFGYLKFGGDE